MSKFKQLHCIQFGSERHCVLTHMLSIPSSRGLLCFIFLPARRTPWNFETDSQRTNFAHPSTSRRLHLIFPQLSHLPTRPRRSPCARLAGRPASQQVAIQTQCTTARGARTERERRGTETKALFFHFDLKSWFESLRLPSPSGK